MLVSSAKEKESEKKSLLSGDEKNLEVNVFCQFVD
jgi:hypothetical protein